MSNKTAEEANRRMLDFIGNNISGIDKLTQDGQNFHILIGEIEFLLITTTGVIKPASGFIEGIKRNGKEGIPAAVLGVRSTSDYEGELLKPAVYLVNGRNVHWRNEKDLTKFEQELIRIYGPLPYYNPSQDNIQIIRFMRSYRIPPHVQRLANSENPTERQRFHIHEGLREKIRKISIVETIDGSFTLEPYERSGKPLVARIVLYQPQ